MINSTSTYDSSGDIYDSSGEVDDFSSFECQSSLDKIIDEFWIHKEEQRMIQKEEYSNSRWFSIC